MRFKTPYDIRAFKMSLVGILLLSAAMKLTGGAAFVLMIPIAFLMIARNKAESLLFVFLLTIATILANVTVMPKGQVYSLAERGIFVILGFALMSQVFGRKNPPILVPLLGLLPYVGYMAIVSFAGWCPVISYMKIFLFVTIFMGYYAIAGWLLNRNLDLYKVRSMILAAACFFILGSIVASRFGWAYMSIEELLKAPVGGTNLFKGMACHSNALGGILSSFSLFLLCDLLFSVQRPDWLYIINIVVALYFIVQSGSRTSMGTFVLGTCFALYCFRKSRTVKRGWKDRVTRGALAIVALGGIALLATSTGREKVVRFIVKNRDENAAVEMSTENVLSSRQGKMEEGMYNWRESPFFGNGFQVSYDMQNFKVNSLNSILSAPVEKSVWVTAVLEEGGVIGFFLFCVFLILVFPPLVKRKAYAGATMLLALLCTNFGEFTFFSLSGGGGLQWGLVFIGLVLDGQRLKDEKKNRSQMIDEWNIPPMGAQVHKEPLNRPKSR